MIFLGWPQINDQLWGIPAGIGVGTAFLLMRFKELELTMSKEFQAILPPISQVDKVRDAIHPYTSALAQEYFYRRLVITAFVPFIGPYAILVSALLFMGEHFFHNNSARMFDWQDYALQFFLGLSLGSVFYFSSSFIGVVVGHGLYNTPAAIQTIRRELE